MKKFYFLLLLLTTCSIQVFSQSMLSQDFGRTYEEVKAFLDSKKELASAEYTSTDMITASTDGLSITYHFNDGVLYKSVIVKSFNHIKEAKVSTESFRNYYTLRNADQMNMEHGRDEERFMAVVEREVHEVSLFSYDKSTVQVIQSKLDLDRCPGAEMIEIVRNESLMAMLSK